jgi:hypothetical protein
MQWARFEVISGLLDALLIVMGVVLMVQFRVIKKTLRRQKAAFLQEDGLSGPLPSPPPAFSSFMKSPADSEETDLDRKWEEARDRDQKRFDTAIREVEHMRSELSILMSDVQRFLDDLTPVVGGPTHKTNSPIPPSPQPPPAPIPYQEESMKDRVFRLSREGRSVSEIAADVGRGEGEVAFLLAMEKVGRS